MASPVLAALALFVSLVSLVAGFPNPFPAPTAVEFALRPRQTGYPTFPSSPPSCPICQASYSSINSCAQSAVVLQNVSEILFHPAQFVDVIECACTDTFQSAYPQCVDCFTKTNQTYFLENGDQNLSSVVNGMRQVCALASTLLGGVATADSEVPSSSSTAAAPTTTSGIVRSRSVALGSIFLGSLVALGVALAL